MAKRKFEVVIEIRDEFETSREEMANYVCDAVASWYGQGMPGEDVWEDMRLAKVKVSSGSITPIVS